MIPQIRKDQILNDFVNPNINKSLGTIITENNIILKILDLSSIGNISGLIFYNSETTSFNIYVSNKDTPLRQRFTIAHELGHFFLHKKELLKGEAIIDESNDYLFRSNIYSGLNEDIKIFEEEANFFAAELLMPRETVYKVWEKLGKNKETIGEIAELFNVSISAMAYRLENLHLIS